MTVRWYTAPLVLAALLPSAVARPMTVPITAASSEAVLVDEVAPAGPTGPASEFVELRNVGAASIDISNWHVSVCVGKRVETLATVPMGALLAPRGQQGEYFLVASRYYDDQQATPDLVFQSGYIPADGGVRLTDALTTTVDSVGFASTSPCTEIAPASMFPYSAVARDANGTDTGDNAVDFTAQPPDPHNSLG